METRKSKLASMAGLTFTWKGQSRHVKALDLVRDLFKLGGESLVRSTHIYSGLWIPNLVEVHKMQLSSCHLSCALVFHHVLWRKYPSQQALQGG